MPTGTRERVWVEKVDKTKETPTAEWICKENGVIVEHLTDLPVCKRCLFHDCVCQEVP